MDAKTISEITKLGVEVVTNMYVVVQYEYGAKTGTDEDGSLLHNLGKDGSPRPVFVTLPNGKQIKVFTGSSGAEIEGKISADTPDITREK